MKMVTVLGATGSVGRTTVNLLKDNNESFNVQALTAGSNWKLLAEQACLLLRLLCEVLEGLILLQT